MAAGGSTKVVVFALLANLGIAVAKLVAHMVTGSTAMLAESIHSFADSGNQALLLVGSARARRSPDARHPLGYGREAYFWAMLVAVVLFSLGGLFSLYEGIHKLQSPQPLESWPWAVGVLILGVGLEGASFLAAWRVCSQVRRGTSLLRWAQRTGNVNLLVVIFEDLAALIGLLLALAAVGLTVITGDPMWDAAGTCVIGVLLLCVAVFVGLQVRRLIAGSAATPETHDTIRAIWETRGFDVLRLIVVWSGPSQMMVACKFRPEDCEISARELVQRMNDAETAVRAAVPEVGFQFSEPDVL